jgi:low affinity Fe/Cu permease
MTSPNVIFNNWARRTAAIVGHPMAFIAAVAIVLLWAVSGPMFHFDNSWQLVINTGTTIITFLMVFLIQNAQNRDSEAVQLKLDELLRVIDAANNSLIASEKLNPAGFEELRKLAERPCDDTVAPIET